MQDKTVHIFKQNIVGGDMSPSNLTYVADGQFQAFGILNNESSIIVSRLDGSIHNLPLSLVKFRTNE